MNLEQRSLVVNDPKLLTLFKVGVTRRAFDILVAQNPPVEAVAWAKRCCLTFGEDRSSYYARLVIEGLLVDNSTFRGLVEQQLIENGAIVIPEDDDEQYISFVEGWVARFIAFNV